MKIEALSGNDYIKSPAEIIQAAKTGDTSEVNPAQLRAMKRSGAIECATCASRKYQDGSDEGNVSFKAAAHINPNASGAAVRSHEQEHVSNAYAKAEKGNGKVLNASVTLKTAICPECGRGYVAGGVTRTSIKYEEESQYNQERKGRDYATLRGNQVDETV